MTTRHVLDVVRDVHGAALPNVDVVFGLEISSYTGAAAYMRNAVTVTTDANGAYDVILWCDEEGAISTRYYAIYPDGVASINRPSFRFDLPVGDGTPVLMSALRTASPAVAAINMQTYVDIALAALTFFNIDGGTPTSIYTGIGAFDGGAL